MNKESAGTAISKDDQVIQLSANQTSPSLARPEDWTITKPDDVPEVAGHGQHGRTRSQYRRLLKQAGDKLGRSAPVDGLGE
jgi:hypothetical protein